MRALALVCLAILLLLGAVAGVLWLLIDPRTVEAALRERLAAAFGQQLVTVEVELDLLPRPYLLLHRPYLAFGDEATASGLRAETIRLELDPAALLGGEVRVAAGHFDQPEILLGAAPAEDVARTASLLSDRFAEVERLSVTAGRLTSETGVTLLEGIGGTVERDPASGRLVLEATAREGEQQLRLHAESTSATLPGTLPLRFELTLAGSEAAADTSDAAPLRIRFDGLLHQPFEAASLTGEVEVAARDVAAATRILAPLRASPAPAPKGGAGVAARARGRLGIERGGATLADAALTVAETEFTGEAAFSWVGSPSFRARLEAPAIDRRTADTLAGFLRELAPGLAAGSSGTIDLRVGELATALGSLRRVTLGATVPGDGSVVIDQSHAELPGNGFIEITGAARFDQLLPSFTGDIALELGNARELLEAGAIPTTSIAAGRLRTLKIEGGVELTATSASLRDADVQVDGTRGEVSAVYVAGPDQRLVVRARLDRLAAEAYLPEPATVVRWIARRGAEDAPEIAVDLAVDRLSWGGLTVEDGTFVLDLTPGQLDVSAFAARRLAGFDLHGRGRLERGDGAFSLDLAGRLLEPQAALRALAAPPGLRAQGLADTGFELVLAGDPRGATLDFGLDGPTLDASVQALGSRAEGGSPSFEVEARLATENAYRVIAPGSDPAAATLPISLVATLRRQQGMPAALGADMSLGLLRLVPDLQLDRERDATRIAGRVGLAMADGAAVWRTFRQVEELAAMAGLPLPIGPWLGQRRAAFLLRGLSATIELGPLENAAEAPRADLQIDAGHLLLDLARLPLAEGRLDGRLQADTVGDRLSVASHIELTGASAGALLQLPASMATGAGTLTAAGELAARGVMLRDLLASISGEVGIALEGLTLPGWAVPATATAGLLPGSPVSVPSLDGTLVIAGPELRTQRPLRTHISGAELAIAATLDLATRTLQATITDPTTPAASRRVGGPLNALRLLPTP